MSYRVITFKLDEKTLEQLDSIIEELQGVFNTRFSRSEIIRSLLRKFVKEYLENKLGTIKEYHYYLFLYGPLYKSSNNNEG